MEKLDYIQLYKDNEKLCAKAQELWTDFIKEVNHNEGKTQELEQIVDSFRKGCGTVMGFQKASNLFHKTNVVILSMLFRVMLSA